MSPRPTEPFHAIADNGLGTAMIFVRDYVVDCNIGVYAEEKGVTQKVRITVDAGLGDKVRAHADDMAEVPSYTDLIDAIHAVMAPGHINLVETFAEGIAARCLADPRIVAVRVRIEKLERGPLRGVEIVRRLEPARDRRS
jgi:dihydroneopterin aldolase